MSEFTTIIEFKKNLQEGIERKGRFEFSYQGAVVS